MTTFREILERYFSALESADFEAATRCFTEDAVYSHPPFPEEGADGPRHESVGRSELLAVFERRGPRTLRHRVDTVLDDGRTGLASGVVHDGGVVVMSFVAQAELDATSGLMARYAAYVSVPAVWAQEGSAA
ncbi:nuclear transport factor 2 family protein [Nocardioides zeae]|uniref:Ketosteroid isomerase-like protein n=1 Tax=Nocardioides zeae TaxID=1457234 RepID=A0AAJ1UAT0_9ACTN|nr:nuclear transport factor 2 family protein [Nocardioides zeae]MDQ1106767.1 ketosteroid isomerase-like protein [Nocardioides zeae]